MESCKCGNPAQSDLSGQPYLLQGIPSCQFCWETQMIIEGEAQSAREQIHYEDTQYERRW